MKIDLASDGKRGVILSDLDEGDTFLICGDVYIKSDEKDGGAIRAMNLETGFLTAFLASTNVTPIALKVVRDTEGGK